MTSLKVERPPTRFYPDSARAITKPFVPGGGEQEDGTSRLDRILGRLFALSEAQVQAELEQTLGRFAGRHRDFRSSLEEGFLRVVHSVPSPQELSADRRLLIGAYFTHEYSIEAAALSNPSAVLALDQSGLPPGSARIVLSLRAIGEGHLSSIEFRTATVDSSGGVVIDEPGAHPKTARHRSPTYMKDIFREKLRELHVLSEVAIAVLAPLSAEFSMADLDAEIEKAHQGEDPNAEVSRVTRTLHWLAASNYESSFSPDTQLSERVLFPSGPTESSGMEDARFVRFVRDDGTTTFFAPYTAYDGYQILPQLIETADFLNFRISTLNGPCARNKGIALFPRKLNGRYAALGRLDNENNYLMTSDDVRFWHESEIIQRPLRPWELTHIGNCGSPLETEAGWLVITHGVGAMRQYALGAILLDLSDPAKVIGSLERPLLEPNENEREGYVPNVVYSCGSTIVGRHLVLPYGFSDSGTSIATVELADLLTELTSPQNACA